MKNVLSELANVTLKIYPLSDIDYPDFTLKKPLRKNHKFVKDAIEHLKGQFGGELDSFYQHVEDRIK